MHRPPPLPSDARCRYRGLSALRSVNSRTSRAFVLPSLARYGALLGIAALVGACDSEPGGFSAADIAELKKLAHPGEPPPDHSNKYIGNAAAVALGKKFYFDPDFSGPATGLDMLARPLSTPGRAQRGTRPNISCNSCHDVAMGGSDHTTDPPGHLVSFGGGAYDVNGQQTVNSAYNTLVYWNARNDSLWSQIVAVEESFVSMAGGRARVAWRIADAYRDEYNAVFGADYPLPAALDKVAAQKARIAADGTCVLDGMGKCPDTFCHTIASADNKSYCVPRFPLDGRPGYLHLGAQPVCDWGSTDPLQPFGDAYDCMDLGDQLATTQILVNFAKAIAAYEFTLRTPDSAFDKWVDEGPATSMVLSSKAVAGARLFVGKAGCKECHAGPLFTDNKLHDVGAPQTGGYVPLPSDCMTPGGWCDCVSDDANDLTNCLPWGARDGLRKLHSNKFRRDSRWSDDGTCQNHFTLHNDPLYAASNPDECDGMVQFYSIPLTDDMKGQWKTPGLRNVELTAPYMHDGAFATLEEVVKHYSNAGVTMVGTQVGKVDKKVQKLDLSDGEIAELVAFLKTLTAPVPAEITSMPAVPPSSNF